MADQAELDRVRAALQRRREGGQLGAADVAAIRRYEERRAAEQRRAALRSVPQVDLVEVLGIPRKTLLEWERDGLPVLRSGRAVSYDLYAVLPWLRRRWAEGNGSGDTTKRAAEIKLLIRREAALQLKMQLLSGELIHRDDVERENCRKVASVRSGLEALKLSLAPAMLELGEEVTLDQAQAVIWEYVEPLLRAFSGRPAPRQGSGQGVSRKGRRE